MSKQLVQTSADPRSQKWLDEFYQHNFIPADKKPFLIDLHRSIGPYLAVDDSRFILDAASQIASNGLGFNSGASFGTVQHLETWCGRTDTPGIRAMRRAFVEMMQRLAGWEQLHCHLVHSGAEAIETALGHCFENRVHRDARRIIAFEGAFHGRMMVALTTTWSPAKREPFAWDGYQSAFAPYPEIKSDDVAAVAEPDDWCRLWSSAPRKDFDDAADKLARQHPDDDLLKAEIKSLSRVRELLESGDYFAILIEPMQCEGGDRFSSARFHRGLATLSKTYSVPLIYDEIQTGFGLGGDFFWHKKFGLDDTQSPDVVVLAKKAQVGAVLTRTPILRDEQYNAASLARGYINAAMIDQYREEIFALEPTVRSRLHALVESHQPHIANPRASGLSFAFDFDQADKLKKFVACRFNYGLLYYPAGTHSARFRLNLAYRKKHLDQLWAQLEGALQHSLSDPSNGQPVTEPASAPSTRSVDTQVRFHNSLMESKLEGPADQSDVIRSVSDFLREAIGSKVPDASALQIHFPTPETYPAFRDRIWDVQLVVYEPLRQTPIEKFDTLIKASGQRSIIVTLDDKIIAMAFSAPLKHFPHERGLRLLKDFESENAIYMLDLTVADEFRGGLGKIMKQAICLFAARQGVEVLIGRNRDRLAQSMWAINLSLGSYTERILEDDYPDSQEYRDCFLYRCPLQWNAPPLNLSNAVTSPLAFHQLSKEFVESNISIAVNKLTLSNFVTKSFLDQLSDVFQLLPTSLRHGYTASGTSECVDKIVKSLWLRRKGRQRLIALQSNFFGNTSFMARSLSGLGEPYFPVTRLDLTNEGESGVQEILSRELSGDDVLAVFAEPLGWHTGHRIPESQLRLMIASCKEHGVPIVFHESASMFHRYHPDSFFASGAEELTPDAGYAYLGGQMAIAYLSEQYFVSDPLTMISTWDGDLLSLAQFHRAVRIFEDKLEDHLSGMMEFDCVIKKILERYAIEALSLTRGIGWFRGNVSRQLAQMFDRNANGNYICLPSPGEIGRFLKIADQF